MDLFPPFFLNFDQYFLARSELLANEHAIAVAVETIAVAHRVFVGVEDAFCTGERGYQNEQA